MSGNHLEIMSAGRSYQLDLLAEELYREKHERVRLTRQQWTLLRYLIENRHKLVYKDDLQNDCWKGAAIGDEAISQAVRGLRRALEDHIDPAFIKTVHGRGYRFIADVVYTNPHHTTRTSNDSVGVSDESSSEHGGSLGAGVRHALANAILPDLSSVVSSAPVSHFRIVTVDGAAITRLIPALTAKTFSIDPTKIAECHISVNYTDEEPFFEDDVSMSYVGLIDRTRVRVPSGYIKLIAQDVGRRLSETAVPLCTYLRIKHSSVVNNREFLPLDDFMVDFVYHHPIDDLPESDRLAFLYELLFSPPCDAGHLWGGRVDTLCSPPIGSRLVDSLSSSDAFLSTLDTIRVRDDFNDEGHYSLIQFSWYLIESCPDLLGAHKNAICSALLPHKDAVSLGLRERLVQLCESDQSVEVLEGPVTSRPVHVHRMHDYDWGASAGLAGAASLRLGAEILYEEHSLDPEFDQRVYARNQQLLIPAQPFNTSPRGFVKLDKDDYEWVDPRDRNRRICQGTISGILEDGRVRLSGTPLVITDIVDIIPT